LRRIGAKQLGRHQRRSRSQFGVQIRRPLWLGVKVCRDRSGAADSDQRPALAAPGNEETSGRGGVHSVALKKDGTLWAWGHNWPDHWNPGDHGSSVPLQVGSATNWIKVWAGILENRGYAI